MRRVSVVQEQIVPLSDPYATQTAGIGSPNVLISLAKNAQFNANLAGNPFALAPCRNG